MADERYPVSVMRGGTSRALIFRADALPAEPAEQDRILMAAMGSPDPAGRQTDGLGGGHPLTSKAAIVGRSSEPDVDVDFTFAQVDVTRPLVDRKSNCGNISAAIGPFAIDNGLVEATAPVTKVRVRNTNTGKLFVAHVSTPADGRAERQVQLDYVRPGGSTTGAVLPTGAPRETLELPDGDTVEVSIVDAATVMVFARMSDLGVAPERTVDELEADRALIERLLAIRHAAGVRCGLAGPDGTVSPAVPKMALVGPPPAGQDGMSVRSLSMGRVHRAYQITGGICATVAAAIPGTLVHEAARPRREGDFLRLAIAHPSGKMELSAGFDADGDESAGPAHVSVRRSARLVMEGTVYVPAAEGEA